MPLHTQVPPASATFVEHSQRPARPPCDQGCVLDQLHPSSQRCQPPALSCVRGISIPVLPAGCDPYHRCRPGSGQLFPEADVSIVVR